MKIPPLFLFLLASAFIPVHYAHAEHNGLAAALRATLSAHPALSGKRAEVESRVYVGDVARAQRYPTLSAQVAAQDNNTSPVTLRARQPLWAFGRIDSGIAYADADVRADEADLVRMQRMFMDQTAVAYARVIGGQQRVQAANENVAALETLYRQIQRRNEGQLASLADVKFGLSRLLQARAQQARYESELTVAESELLALTQTPVAVDASLPAALTKLPDLATMETLALDVSADVRLKSRRVELAEADVGREQTAALPTVYLQAHKYMNQPTYGSTNQANYTNETRVSVALEASLDGMGFAASGRSQAAGARKMAAIEDLNATRNEVLRTVRSLYANRQLQQTLIESQDQSVTELADLLASYQRQYEAGFKQWLEVLNIQRELSDQQLQRIQAGNEWLINTLKLHALTGGLDALVNETRVAIRLLPRPLAGED